ncbi:unnamed protein product [Clavelina lepadiformis]|uniref:Protein-PII uridylyltransferase N-terminal domain-containing protein n=1 Tax=Clavelina lepadiformis TaxID=159417 RepID=A0ABP0FLP6_CLALP
MTATSQQSDLSWKQELILAKKIYKERSIKDNSITKRLSLIRSAALLNAAVTRQPGNEKFKQSLKDFCSDLLKTVGAKILEADLLNIAEQVKQMATEMREEAKESLKMLKKIPYDVPKDEEKPLEKEKIESMKTIQKQVTLQYKNIMKYVSVRCEDIMGNPPCKYSITGMGSLARCEITPYSDFEHIILLEEGAQEKDNYPEVLEYFRWFSVVFQTIIINLQETIIPSVAIPSFKHVTEPGEKEFFDAYTKRGISFDWIKPYACHFPLGRMEKTNKKPWTTEFIKPVSEMLTYLDKDEDLRNGYNIPNVIITTSPVYGDKQIHQQFCKGVKDVLRSDKRSSDERVLQQLDEDLKNFDTFNSLGALAVGSTCDIKRLVYRTSTLFISALGRLNSIDDGSSFAIIDQLNNNNIIDEQTAHLLSYAIAVSCQVRMMVYIEKESQDDDFGEEQLYDASNNKVYANLVDTFGERSMMDYFAIAYNLQKVLRDENILSNSKFNITLKPIDKFKMLHMLELHNRTMIEWKCYLQEERSSKLSKDDMWIRYYVAQMYCLMHQPRESLLMLEWFEEYDTEDPLLKAKVMRYKARCLNELDRFQEALQFIGRAKCEVLNLNLSDSDKYILRSDLARISGQCRYALKEFQRSMDEWVESSVYINRADQLDVARKEIYKAGCFQFIALCLYEIGEYDAAINETKKRLRIYEQYNAAVKAKCSCYDLLGLCHLEKSEYEKSLHCFQTKLDLSLQFVPSEEQNADEDIKKARASIQLCQMMLTLKC